MKYTNTIPAFLLIAALASVISGCGAVIVGAAATGVAVAHDRRTTGTIIDDNTLSLKISDAIFQEPNLSSPTSHINVTVYNGAVLLTGETPTEDLKVRTGAIATRIAAKSGEDRIYNEIMIAAPTSMLTRTQDTYITGKVKSSLLKIRDIPGFDPTRVKIITENSVVFLMGLVTQQEAEAATELVRGLSGISKVVRLFEYIEPQ